MFKNKLKKFNQLNKLHKAIYLLFFSIAIFIITYVIIRTAWINDDAYITLRTVDNILNGYGPKYNLTERVQTYTHPLWMFVLVMANFIAKEAYFSTILVSAAISILAMLLLLIFLPKKPFMGFVGVTILMFSKAFIDYSTSGLENPLSHLLTVLFFALYLSKNNYNLSDLFLLIFISMLCAVNRLDIFLIFIPPIIHVLFGSKKLLLNNIKKTLVTLFLSLSPIIIWFSFSLLYYGFLFPNTAYAKLNTGIPKWDLFQQGLIYFLDSIINDPLTLLIVVIGILLAFLTKKFKFYSIAVGILLYLIYIIYIGGDFMSGRFFTLPILVAVIIIISSDQIHNPKNLIMFSLVVLVVGFLAPFPPILSNKYYGQLSDNYCVGNGGIADERACYFQQTGLFRNVNGFHEPEGEDVERGINYRNNWTNEPIIYNSIGFFGYYAGPQNHVIDRYALADPLLARLPISDLINWRIGHFSRVFPDGYIYSMILNKNIIKNNNIAEYYDILAYIIQRDIFDHQRLKYIWEMNLGKYDHLLTGE